MTDSEKLELYDFIEKIVLKHPGKDAALVVEAIKNLINYKQTHE